MGKWSEISRALPRREDEPGAFQSQVSELKDADRGKALDELATKYRQVRKEKEVLETVEKGLNAREMALAALISEVFVSEDRDKPFYFTDGARIEVSDQISVRAANSDAIVAWMKANNYERMLSVNPKRLEGLTKAALEAGQDIPDGVVVTAYSQVKLTGKQ